MFLWLKTLYRKRAVTWPFIFYTIIWTLSNNGIIGLNLKLFLLTVKIKKNIIGVVKEFWFETKYKGVFYE